MAAYYACKQRSADVYLSIVGRGRAETLDELRRTVRQNGLETMVRFTGPLFGEALDREFDRADMAVGSLGRHRSGISYIKNFEEQGVCGSGNPVRLFRVRQRFRADALCVESAGRRVAAGRRRIGGLLFRTPFLCRGDPGVRAVSFVENQMRKVLGESLKTA